MPETIRIRPVQPLPVVTLVGRLNGVTAIHREWDPGDPANCQLCDECTATERGACTILTEEPVSQGGAPLYSSRGLDFGGEDTGRIRAPLGLAR